MTAITPTTNTDANKAPNAASKLNGDFNMFLKLLTTQMQNQDPLSPMDTAQYTQQLVQYSQVEQSIEQTGTLKSILSSLGTQNLTQASSLIGHQVETNSATAGLSDTPAQWRWTAPHDVTQLVATITDAKGRVVDTRTIAATGAKGDLSWAGLAENGRQLGAGNYTLALKGTDAAGNSQAITVHSIGTVSDVQLDNGAIKVSVNGLQFGAGDLVRIGQ